MLGLLGNVKKSAAVVPGPWFLIRGPWSLVPGPWFLLGPWSLVPPPCALVPGPWSLVLVLGPWSFVPVLVPGPCYHRRACGHVGLLQTGLIIHGFMRPSSTTESALQQEMLEP